MMTIYLLSVLKILFIIFLFALRLIIYMEGYAVDLFTIALKCGNKLFSVILDRFKLTIPKTQSQKCQMWMLKGSRVYAGILCHGEGGVLRGPDSDVQLYIPQDIYGLIIGSVCTDNSEFSQQIPNKECIVAPMVEFKFCSSYEHEPNPRLHYIITIPHCLDEDSAWDLIKVRKFKSRSNDELIEVTQYDASQNQETFYVIEKHFVRIYTKHFCQYFCSTCEQSKCKESAMVFFYGSILHPTSNTTEVMIKPFFCSFLFNNNDYRKVRHFYIIYLI